MVGNLKNIDIGELSFTKGTGANRKKYAFIKNDKGSPEGIIKIIKDDLAISIKSDGTARGTKVRVNGRGIENLKDFSFNLFNIGSESEIGDFGVEVGNTDQGNIECSYTISGKEKNGFTVSNKYYLMKNDMEVKEEMKVNDLVKQYFGEEVKVVKKEPEAIEKSLETINEYKESFPEELEKAVGVIMKKALLEKETPEESKDEPEDKTDVEETESEEKKKDKVAELSEDNVSEIVKMVMKKLVPEKETSEEGKGDKAITKKLDEINEKISKKDESIGKLTERLVKVEKVKGIKKQIDGQDDDDDGEVIKKSDKKWPSFNGK